MNPWSVYFMKEGLLQLNTFSFHRLQQSTTHPFWKPITVLGCVLLCIVLNNPDYRRFSGGESLNPVFRDYAYNWQSVYDQINHPFTPQHHPQTSHQAKRAFRILPALIGTLLPGTDLNSRLTALFAIQHLLGLLSFYLLLELLLAATGDKVYSLLGTLSFAFIYWGSSFFWDLYGWFDGIAYFWMILTLYLMTRSQLTLAFLTLSAAFWTDERAIIASPAVLFWFVLIRRNLPNLNGTQAFRQPILLWYMASLVTYGLLRSYLGYAYHLAIPLGFGSLVGLKMIIINLQAMPFSLFSIFEGLWLPFLLLGWWLYHHPNRFLFWLMLGCFGTFLFIALCVIDVTRSVSYSFPWILVGLVLVHRVSEANFARKIGLLSLLISLVFPNLFYLGKAPVLVASYSQIIRLLGFSE